MTTREKTKEILEEQMKLLHRISDKYENQPRNFGSETFTKISSAICEIAVTLDALSMN
jgi:hypothetical protein